MMSHAVAQKSRRNLLHSHQEKFLDTDRSEGFLKISIQRVYLNLPFIWTFLSFAIGFYLFVRSFAGYAPDREILSAITDLGLSFGLFLIGLPAMATIAGKSKTRNPTMALAVGIVAFQTILFLGSLYFLFGYLHPGYFGLEQLPENEKLLFWSLLLGSIISSFIFLLDHLLRTSHRDLLSRMLFVFLFALVGIGMGSTILQGMEIFGGQLPELYAATIPAAEFLRQLVIVSSLAIVSMKLFNLQNDGVGKFIPVAIVTVSFFMLIGFQSASLLQNASSTLFFVNQLFSAIGLAGFVSINGVLISRRWRHSPELVLAQGEWTAHLALALALALTSLVTLGSGKMVLSSGVLDNFRIGLFVALPLLFSLVFDRKRPQSNFLFPFSQVLIWCGLFVFVLPLIAIAPFGGGLHMITNVAFRPYFEIVMCGVFMLLLSFVIILWDKFLTEFI